MTAREGTLMLLTAALTCIAATVLVREARRPDPVPVPAPKGRCDMPWDGKSDYGGCPCRDELPFGGPGCVMTAAP